MEQPLNLAATAVIANKLRNEPLAGCFRWFPDEYVSIKKCLCRNTLNIFQTQINVISRKTGTLCRKFYAASFFYLHIINQYEDSGHVVVDICVYRDPSMLDCMYIETMKVSVYMHLWNAPPNHGFSKLHTCSYSLLQPQTRVIDLEIIN